jgi:hypothetical protein
MRALFAGIQEVASDAAKPTESSEIATTMKHLREMTRIADSEINRVVLDCTRARRHLMGTVGTAKPTRH